MFTGLIQKTGVLLKMEEGGEAVVLTLEAGGWSPPLQNGESIAVDGVCLTVVGFTSSTVCFHVLKETLNRASLKAKKTGERVNLERALRLGDSMGGHIVTGHVDGVGVIRSLTRSGHDWVVETACPSELMAGIVPKGSIALDGISLTIAELRPDSFTVHIIPHTWQNTSLSQAHAGRKVNLETDILGKYVARCLQREGPKSSVDAATLRNAGFIE